MTMSSRHRIKRLVSKLGMPLLLASLFTNAFLLTREMTGAKSSIATRYQAVDARRTVSNTSQVRISPSLQRTTYCSVTAPWSSRLVKPVTTADFTDWSFKKRLLCPTLPKSKSTGWREKVSLDCARSPTIVTTTTNSSSDIYSVKLGDACLNRFLDKCCTGRNKVPNVVHYIWYSSRKLGFFNFLSFMSALRFVKPCLFLLHGDSVPYGPYWDLFLTMSPNIIQVYRKAPTKVFNHTLAFKEHASDVMRIEALMTHGGIYLDFDEVVLRSLDPLRDYEYTQGHELPHTLGSQLVMARRNATFLHYWYKSYANDYRRSWAYNALILPNQLANQYPKLIHVEGFNFTRPNWKNVKQIFRENYNWSENYGMHLFIRWYKNETDVNVIRRLNTTIGAVSRHILFGNKELCSN